ncbi:MAG: hypothetical protein V2A58_11635 [Planctomycetota bacterium]
MSSDSNDLCILRDLVKQYLDVAHEDVQDARRRLWSAHHSLAPTPAPVLLSFGMWNVWCREIFGDSLLRCADPFYREHERSLRMKLFHHSLGDDFICEPWISVGAHCVTNPDGLWGVSGERLEAGVEGGACAFDHPIKTWSDCARLVPPRHEIDEEATARNLARLRDAVGDLIEIDDARGCALTGFNADISTGLGQLRGIQEFMLDMYESPAQLHGLLAFMRDGILSVQDAAEAACDFTLATQKNQVMTYADDLPAPAPNAGPRLRKDLWCHCAAQEFTLVSPAMHDEFLLEYQLPVIRKWGLVCYGCCEDLTNKIDMLRRIPNLRTIAVTPVADVARCAQEIGDDYCVSWRPSPADMVCCGFDENRVRRIIRKGLESLKGCCVHVCLKDVETVEGDPSRLSRWVRLVRSITEETGVCVV